MSGTVQAYALILGQYKKVTSLLWVSKKKPSGSAAYAAPNDSNIYCPYLFNDVDKSVPNVQVP